MATLRLNQSALQNHSLQRLGEVNDPPNESLGSRRKLLGNYKRKCNDHFGEERNETRIWISAHERTGVERRRLGRRRLTFLKVRPYPHVLPMRCHRILSINLWRNSSPISQIRKLRFKMVNRFSRNFNTWWSQGSSWGLADSSLCVCVCVSHPTPLPSLLWGHRRGNQRGCWHYTDAKRPWGTGLKDTSHAVTIDIDFKYSLEAPESQLLPLFWNTGSNSLSFLPSRDLYKL